MPFGIAPAPEEFHRRLNEAIEGHDGVRTIANDIIVFGVGETLNMLHCKTMIPSS